jgi:hypothetical protein
MSPSVIWRILLLNEKREASVMIVENVINKGKKMVLCALTSLVFWSKTHWFEKKSICWPETPVLDHMAQPELAKLFAKMTRA